MMFFPFEMLGLPLQPSSPRGRVLSAALSAGLAVAALASGSTDLRACALSLVPELADPMVSGKLPGCQALASRGISIFSGGLAGCFP